MDNICSSSSEEMATSPIQENEDSERTVKEAIGVRDSTSQDSMDNNRNKTLVDTSSMQINVNMNVDFDCHNQANELSSSKSLFVGHNVTNERSSFDDEGFAEPPIPDTSVVDLQADDNDKWPPGDQGRKHYGFGAGGIPPNPRQVERPRFNVLNIVRFRTDNPPQNDEIVYLDDKRQRVFFTAKIFMFKAFHMLICLGLVLQFAQFRDYRELQLKYHSLSYLVLFLYLMLYVTIRVGNYGKKLSGAIICLLINTLCVVLISSSVYINADPYLACGMLTVLCISYVAISTQSIVCRVDITESNNIVFTYLGLVFVITIGSLAMLVNVVPPQVPYFPARMVTGIFLPLWMIAECIILLQLSEVAQIILGLRFETPHRKLDFLRSSAYLL